MQMVFLNIIKSLPPVAAIFLVSLFISFLVTLVYKLTTNQALMKALHHEMKSLRDNIKSSKDPSQATALNKQLMEKTMQQMMHSMKSTFITIIPVFIIFGWLNANLAFVQILPGEEFTASMAFKQGTTGTAAISADSLEIIGNSTQEISNNRASWKLKGKEGTHVITYLYGNETYTRDAIVTGKWAYADPYLEKKKTLFGLINVGDKNPIKPDSSITRAAVELEPMHPLGEFKLFGWIPGWLATYFIFTLLLTFPIRKLLKVH